MKKTLLAASMLGLVGCSAIQYNQHRDELQSSSWEDAGVSFHDAKEYEGRGISYEEYDILSSKGASGKDEIEKLDSLFPFDMSPSGQQSCIVPSYDKEYRDSGRCIMIDAGSDGSNGLSNIIYSLHHNEFTIEELSYLLRSARRMNENGEENTLGRKGTFVPLYADTLISNARALHQGVKVEDIIRKDIQDDKIKAIKYLEKRTKEFNEEQEKERQADIAEFGRDIVDICHGVVRHNDGLFRSQDPYNIIGQCVVMKIPSFLPPEFGRRQWINPNTLLSTGSMGGMTETFILEADEHIKLDTRMVVIGTEPYQYQNSLGTLQTPLTFRVLKFY